MYNFADSGSYINRHQHGNTYQRFPGVQSAGLSFSFANAILAYTSG